MRLNVNVGYIGGGVEELGKEADPGEELNLTYFAGLGGKTFDRCEDSREEGEEATFALWFGGIESRVSFFDGQDAEGYSAAECQGRDDAEHFELSVAEKPQVFGKVTVACNIAYDVPNAHYPTGHRVCGFCKIVSDDYWR